MKGGIAGAEAAPVAEHLFTFRYLGTCLYLFLATVPMSLLACDTSSPLHGVDSSLHSLVTPRTRMTVGPVGSSHLLGRDLWYSCQQRAASKRLLIHHISWSSWTWPVSPLSQPVLPLGYLPWHLPDPVGSRPAPGSLGFPTHTCKCWILAHILMCFSPKRNDKKLINFKES